MGGLSPLTIVEDQLDGVEEEEEESDDGEDDAINYAVKGQGECLPP